MSVKRDKSGVTYTEVKEKDVKKEEPKAEMVHRIPNPGIFIVDLWMASSGKSRLEIIPKDKEVNDLLYLRELYVPNSRSGKGTRIGGTKSQNNKTIIAYDRHDEKIRKQTQDGLLSLLDAYYDAVKEIRHRRKVKLVKV